MPDLLTRHRFTVDDYYRMAEVGIIARDARVELIHGEVVEMSPQNSPHGGFITRIERLLGGPGRGYLLRVQLPLRIDRHNEPEPDFVLARLRDDDYIGGHAAPADALLLIEVADSSLDYDRDEKDRLYARAGVPEYWILNLPERCIEVRRDPSPEGYRTKLRAVAGESVTAVAASQVKLTVDEVFA